MKEKIIIIGAGETAVLAYEYFSYDSEYDVIAFVAEKNYIKDKILCGIPVVPFETVELQYPPTLYKAFVAMYCSELNRQRTKFYNLTKKKGYNLVSYVSSKATIWHNVNVGENCFIFEENNLQPFTTVGNNVVMWSGNHLGHRSIIRDNCFITSHVVICGQCEIGENTIIGVNSSIGDFLKIAEDNYITMGTVVTKNTEKNKIYRGNPAISVGVSAKRFWKVKE